MRFSSFLSMQMICFWVVIVLFLPACSTKTFIINEGNDSLKQANSQLKGLKGQIHLVSGESYEGQRIVMTEKSVTWLDKNLKSPKSVETSKVRIISVKSQKKYGIHGLLIGIVAGGMTGYVLAKETAKEDCSLTSRPHLCLGNELGGIAVTIIGGVIGYGIGNNIGSTTNYILNQP